jgi:uncharacterized protein YkwD
MSLKKIISMTVFAAILLTQIGCKKDANTAVEEVTTPVVISPRQQAIDDYEQLYLASNVTTVGWTGNRATCAPGGVAAGVNDKVVQRINYYRKLVGLPAKCTHDAALAMYAQKAALIMQSNNTLTTTPTNTWACYSADGNQGARNSNLSMGVVASDAIDAFMIDNGMGNEGVKHRRWLLFSRAKTFGHGSTTSFSALYCMHNGSNPAPVASEMPEFVAYPPKGNIVQDLFRANMRWSFAIPNADFGSAAVTVKTETGANVTVTKELLQSGCGDNTFVFMPAIASLPLKDTKYTVTVSGVKMGTASKSYTYDVNWVKR